MRVLFATLPQVKETQPRRGAARFCSSSMQSMAELIGLVENTVGRVEQYQGAGALQT